MRLTSTRLIAPLASSHLPPPLPLLPHSARRRHATALGAAVICLTTVLGTGGVASAAPEVAVAPYFSDVVKPDILPALRGYNALWRSSGGNDLHGAVLGPRTLRRNDQLVSWINQHATGRQQVRALQDSAYLAADGSGYDQSLTIADGLGQKLGSSYVRGRISGALPLTSALINSSNGSVGAYVSTSTAKATFSYPRPYLPVSAVGPTVPGDSAQCAPAKANGSSLAGIRSGVPWATAAGNLRITRVAPIVDTSHAFATTDVALNPSYGDPGICLGGSYPSGHTTTAYEAGLALATLLPEVAPQILARASEAGNNRIVLGVHYPLDIIGGRIDGEVGVAARWSDTAFRTRVLEPARAELVRYLTQQCGTRTLALCIATDRPYTDDPYDGNRVPGGTSQRVTDRRSALRVYTERLSYGFAATTSRHQTASVPTGAESLLLSSYPGLSAPQRRSVLAQTEIASGHPLDTTAAHRADAHVPGSWQRLNLAAAMSATVRVDRHGTVTVIATGGTARVLTRR